MLPRIGADLVLLIHLAFVLFVVFGSLLVLRWPRLVWLHLPAAVWGVVVELTGWVCPLTPLEQQLRVAAGEGTYSGGFIGHYVWPLLYPAGLTREMQLLIAASVLLINGVAYGWLLIRHRRIEARRMHASDVREDGP